ncbi:MAG: hypothetical protein RL701_4052, partial [Pseudomonadota bacterium]
RVTSPTDVMTNAAGAWAGGLAHAQVGPFLDRRLKKQLSLHLPLANLLYLIVPLLSLDAMAARDQLELWPELLLSLFMAWIAAGLYKHRLEGSDRPFAYAYAGAIGLLFGIGWFPVCVHSWRLWAFCTLAVAVLTRIAIAIATTLPKTERRFVPITIQRALPFLCLYVVALGARAELAHLLGIAAAPETAVIDAGPQAVAFVLLRDVAAFTLFGYVCSELQARSAAHGLAIMLRVLVSAVPLAAGFMLLQRSTWLANDLLPGRTSVLAAAALAGSAIHRAQLRMVQSWGRPSQFAKQ